MECPKDLIERAKVLYYNGRGFQAPGTGVDDCFVLCKYKSESELSPSEMTSLIEKTGCKSCEQIEYLGHLFITIHWSDYKYHAKVLTELLRMGVSYAIQNRVQVWFDHKVETEYTDEREQELMLESYEKLNRLYQFFHNQCFDYNWTLPKGKELAKKLYEEHKNTLDPYDNHYDWPIFQKAYDKETLI